MSMSVIGSIAPKSSLPELQQATPAPASSKQSSSSSQDDTATISAAAQKASQSGDVDHDGDSR